MMPFPDDEKFSQVSMTSKLLPISFKMKSSSVFFRTRNIHQAEFLSKRHLVVHSGNLHAHFSAAVPHKVTEDSSEVIYTVLSL